MGVYSTLHISRTKALEVWRSKILKTSEPSNEELSDILDVYLEPRLYNCRVFDDDFYNEHISKDDHVI